MMIEEKNKEGTIIAKTLASGHVLILEQGVHDDWDNAAASTELIKFSDPEPLPPQIPQTVTRRQARQALLIAGHLSSVQPAIDAIPDALQRGMVQIEWDDSQTFERQRPTLIALATAIGMGSEAIDNLFIQAAQL